MTANSSAPRPAARRRRWLLACAALVGLAFLAVGVAQAQGRYRLPGLRGGSLSSADLDSGSHVIVVWASWSPRCRDIVDRTNAIADRWGGRARVVTVVFQEDAAAVEKFLDGKSLAVATFLDSDGEFSKAHAVTSLPGLVVVRDGEARYQGRLPTDADSAIADALR
ncbi:MAG: TlpA family protein disulfide reductase [Acidobacteria bacterium]|nr:TlpA family protein disulfide reductase [Acidobacteriota bacterium]MCB9377522.1 TlpA family protein disulfide reductase [Holophagales bacterium]